MKITRSSDEYRTIAQLVYEGLYVLGVEDIYGITRFNCDEIVDGKWGQFPCNATAQECVEDVFSQVYSDYHHSGYPDVGSDRSSAHEAIDEDMPDYLTDLCGALGFVVEDPKEVEDGE